MNFEAGNKEQKCLKSNQGGEVCHREGRHKEAFIVIIVSLLI